MVPFHSMPFLEAAMWLLFIRLPIHVAVKHFVEFRAKKDLFYCQSFFSSFYFCRRRKEHTNFNFFALWWLWMLIFYAFMLWCYHKIVIKLEMNFFQHFADFSKILNHNSWRGLVFQPAQFKASGRNGSGHVKHGRWIFNIPFYSVEAPKVG